jgi:predicted TIM-barrel fold metal-dependent hydrolase
MRIDAHQSFTAVYTPGVLAPILKRNRFEGSVVVCHSDDVPFHFELARNHAFIQAVVAWADLTAPDLGHTLDAYQRHPKFRGVVSSFGAEFPTTGLAELALRAFGPDRLMFGSDWPAYLPEGTFKESLAAFMQSIGPLPEEVREHLLGGTAARVYRIGHPGS